MLLQQIATCICTYYSGKTTDENSPYDMLSIGCCTSSLQCVSILTCTWPICCILPACNRCKSVDEPKDTLMNEIKSQPTYVYT